MADIFTIKRVNRAVHRKPIPDPPEKTVRFGPRTGRPDAGGGSLPPEPVTGGLVGGFSLLKSEKPEPIGENP